jgi:hypothetical protein
MYFSLFEAGILGPLASPANLETPEYLSTEDVSSIVQVPPLQSEGSTSTGPMYFVFCRLYPFSPQPPTIYS